MKLCCGDERARWGPAACPGWARASERERASLTDGQCNPAILPDTAHQNVLTTPPCPQGPWLTPRDACDHSGRCARGDEPSRMRLSSLPHNDDALRGCLKLGHNRLPAA